MMYDPKTGKGYKAEVEADHVKYKKMGYGHEKPSVSEGKGLWANIHAKRKRGEKMNPKGHPDAPSSKEMKMASEAKEDDTSKEDNSRTGKMNQLFRMGLAKKGELSLMMRMMKRGDDALKDPKLRTKMYELLNDLVDIVTTDKQVFVKVRQNVQKNKDTDAVEEAFKLAPQQVIVTTIDVLNVNRQFDKLVESKSINT
jgi:hypothetical protein